MNNESWRNWSREELDYQYTPSRWSKQGTPDEVIKHHQQWQAKEAKRVRESIECELNISYGMADDQKLDIFGANTLPRESPIFVFIHGGYWQVMTKEDYSYIALPLTKAGAVTILMEYTRAPKANMGTIVSEVKQGMSYIMNFAKRRESCGVYLCGHSAGGQLAAILLSVDWMAECMIPSSLIKGALLISGIYDLRPLVSSPINDPLKMTEATALENSPITVMEDIIKQSKSRRIELVVADEDPAELRRQTDEAWQVLKHAGTSSNSTLIPGVDHFGVVENIIQESFQVTQIAIEMMGLNIGNIDQELKNTAV